MKRIIIKRLLYRDLENNHMYYGGEEYDGNIASYNILCMIYEEGKHEWGPSCKSLYQKNVDGEWQYQVYVNQFEYAEKSWYNLMFDNIKRILRM